jgi:hypothetical protein
MTSESADAVFADDSAFHAESAAGAPSTDGETGLTEHHPLSTPESHNGDALAPSKPADLSEANHDQLEDRIRRLEDALAQLHEMKEQQAREAAAKPAAPVALAVSAPVARIVSNPSPITVAPTDSAGSFLFHVGKQFLAPPVASVVQPSYPPQESAFAAGMRWTSFLFDAYAEMRVIFRMFVDPRYPLSWTSRLVPLVLALLLFTSGFWAPGASLLGVGTLIEKVIDLPLAFLFFKVLSHEARRYRQTSPDLPPALRLPPER